LGIFLCITCAGVHRKLGVHVSRVKSIMLDTWKPEDVAAMVAMGNTKSNEIYEGDMHFCLPVKANTDTAAIFKEQWIWAKYVRKLYKKTDGSVRKFQLPTREGFMTKKGEVVKNWKRRWFSLNGSMLFYYKKQGDATPAGWISVLDTQRFPECMRDPPAGQTYCFTITTPSREYFINAETGEDMYDWIQALRTAKSYLSSPSKYGSQVKAHEVPESRLEQLEKDIQSRTAIHKRKVNGKVYGNCAHGAQIVDFLINSLGLETRADAVVVGQKLLDKGVIRSFVPGDPFSDSPTIYTTLRHT